MKQLKILILFFCVALSIPLAYFILRTHRSLDQDEMAELRYFADTLFNQMEAELAALVVKEEEREIDEYNYFYSLKGQGDKDKGANVSPLSKPSKKQYILGYFQNNPDGSIQTPVTESMDEVPDDRALLVDKLKDANRVFNKKRTSLPEKYDIKKVEIRPAPAKKKNVESFADKYLELPKARKRKAYLGQEKKRVESVTLNQALKIAQHDQKEMLLESRQSISKGTVDSIQPAKEEVADISSVLGRSDVSDVEEEAPAIVNEVDIQESRFFENFQVEVDPMQSVFLNDQEIFIFRRIMIDNKIYRQGFILKVESFLNYLSTTFFSGQPMARFAGLDLNVKDHGRETSRIHAGALSKKPVFLLKRTFPRPFSFLHVTLGCDSIPKSKGRSTLNIMMILMAVVITLGMFAIYKSTRTIVDLSERRTTFVSAVTHELKTPLTNIRMYIEMLEQGIARDSDREEDYFRILGSESSRLSRLINNVLEFSKLEKKTRHFELEEGSFDDVIKEVADVMQEKLKQEGFTLKVNKEEIPPFKYDREVMVQVLINLMENSMKFGKTSPVKEISLLLQKTDGWIKICISDTGPGIPRSALKKVFDDFYRVDNSLTRTTGGTGIGLALVKKFITAMGGSVSATNNNGPGCTITIALPHG